MARNGTSPRLWGDCFYVRISAHNRRYIPTLVGRFTAPDTDVLKAPVHPHACGEIAAYDAKKVEKTGTSPRLWGDWGIYGPPATGYRYIPTLVGRLLLALVEEGVVTVHPHACGEISYEETGAVLTFGTSPRLWGDFSDIPRNGRVMRYIPTLVGRFAIRCPMLDAQTVHPHACGEIQSVYGISFARCGTSPRLWGD